MPDECRVIMVSNLAPGATKDQMRALFSFIGKVDDVALYPEVETVPGTSRLCFVKFEYSDDVGVALHLSNTVFVDRAIVISPVPDGKIPDETTALTIHASCPGGNFANFFETEAGKADAKRRTVYVSNLVPAISPDHLLETFGSKVGEVKYIRMAGDEGTGSKAAFIEFTEETSVSHALALNGHDIGGCIIRVVMATTPITKPAVLNVMPASSKELEQAMKKVDEAQPLISAVLDPDRRSRSRSHRSHSKHRSRSRSRRSRSRKRSRSRSHRSKRRSRSRRKSRSPRRRSRSRTRRHRSRSRSRDRRRRSKSRSPKSSRSKRSRSRDREKKSDTKVRNGTPSKDGKRYVDEKNNSKASERSQKYSSRRRSRSPKPSLSRRRSRSRSTSATRKKSREERRRSPERSKERSSHSRSTRDDAKEREHRSKKEHSGRDDSGRSRSMERKTKTSPEKRHRETDYDETDDDARESESVQNEENTSEYEGHRSDDHQSDDHQSDAHQSDDDD